MSQTNLKYYIYGLRPIIEEMKHEGFSVFYAFQADNGNFEEDITYKRKIRQDLSGDSEQLTKEEFDKYVEKLKHERGLV